MNKSLPTRQLREHPDLNQLKRQAKELRDAFLAGEHAAVSEVNSHYRGADPAAFALHEAQLALARAYGFESWPKLKAYVDGVTMGRFIGAIRSGDGALVRAMLAARPELARRSADNLAPLHHAVLRRDPDIVRALMDHGANPHEGVYPHRDATGSLALATDRGYREIVAIMEEGERRARAGAPAADRILPVLREGNLERTIALFEAEPDLIHAVTPEGWTPIHGAAWTWNEPLAAWLLAHGADPNHPGPQGITPMDATTTRPARASSVSMDRFLSVVDRLRQSGAQMTARVAVALSDAAWVRARHAEDALPGPLNGTGGLLRVAVSHDQTEMLKLLLDLGFDPDERVRVEGIDELEYSWGFPLWECAATGKHELARLLLERGADPNADVYASGTPVNQALARQDHAMVELLQGYGGAINPAAAGLYRRTELARSLLAGEIEERHRDGMFRGKPVAEELLWGGACGGDPEICRLALDRIDWPRDDARWFGILEQPLRIWNHGSGFWARHDWDRTTYVSCFRLILKRADPNLRGRGPDQSQFGCTILHSVAGSRDHVTAEERVAFAEALLDAGARLDLRDNLLCSTPLGWACRWGRLELVKLFLDRGADPVEADSEPWARPRAWAERMKHTSILALLDERGVR